MVRETRHLWVGNLPENIREDRIREHFKRYGRVQSVKIFSRKGGECDGNGLVGCGTTGICATVSFMDIKSASKAHNNEHKLDEHSLTTEYHEPAAIPSAPPASAVPPSVSSGGSPVTQATPPSLRHPPPYSSPRFTHGPAEEITTFDRSSHFYERRDGTENYVRRAPSAYHVVSPSESLRGRTRERDRLYRNGPPHYTPILESVVARTPPTHHRTVTTTGWNSYESTSCSRYPSSVVTTPEILTYPEERRESTPVIIVHKKHPKSRRKCRVMRRCGSNGSESVSNNSDSSRSRSHSSSSSSHSRSSSSSSDSSSAAISERSCSTHSHHGSLKSTVTVHSTISTPLTNCSPVVHTEDRRPLAICVRNLPARSSESSLKDGLYHEYKKHGKVTSVKVLGQGANRYAIVCFKKADDVEKALQVSHDKLFFGSKIEVTIYHGYDIEDNDFRPIEAELDEYHPKATRTLFIGNLEKDVTVNDLRNTFQKFGEIIDIDIKKQGVTCYAFCQYCDISSVVKAMHAMDGEYLGNNKINLGYGKSLATNCLWVAGVADCVTEKQLSGSFSQFGHVTHVDIDRSQGKALVFFQQVIHAQAALSQMRGYVLKNRRLMADYASRECQENFYDNYEKSKSVISAYENNCQDSPRSTGSTRGLDTPVSSTSSNGGNNTTTKLSLNTSSSNTNNSSNNKLHSRYQNTTPTLHNTPTHQPVQQTPSSNSASPIVNNTPSPSPSTSSRSTPRPQQTSRFDYSNTECSSDRRISRSLEDLNINIDNNSEKPPTPNPQDDLTLQKERVTLLEQLNDYSSSEDDDDEEELTSVKQQNSIRQQRSTSREESRPGTPLCDERPENILAHYESRRAAKEKNSNNTPLSLPLPSFANKVPRSSSPSERSSKSPHQSKSNVSRSFDSATRTPSSSSSTSYTRQSPSPHAKDKPSILDSKLSSITSFDSLTETLKAPWIEQLKSLDEKYEKWHGSRSKVLSGKLDTSTIQTKHKLLDVNSIGRQRSEICQTVLSRKSVFDDHFKRLETITDQTPADLPPPRVTVNNAVRSHTMLIPTASILPVCTKPPTVNNVAALSPTSSTTSTSSSSVIKGLQYPFPSHPPPPKTAAVSKLQSNFASSSVKLPDSISPTSSAPSSIHASNARPTALLKNNSVEKLTELPKITSPVTSRETLSRLEPTEKKDASPVSSRRSSLESVGRKSIDDLSELINERKDKFNHKTPQDVEKPVKIVNHELKTKFNNCSYDKSTTPTEKENSVLDKRKNSIDRSFSNPTSSECCNAVSVIFHTSQRDKLSKSLEDVSEIDKPNPNNRRSSIEFMKDDRVSNERLEEKSKKDVVNNTHKKCDKPEIVKKNFVAETKRDKKEMVNHCDKPIEDKKPKIVPYNHVSSSEDEDKKKETKSEKKEDRKLPPKETKNETNDEDVKANVVDEDDDDSNDVDDNKTILVKNKIIETVFHVKHEKKKSVSDGKEEEIKVPKEKRRSISEKSSSKEETKKDDKPKKECIKTKEFNMFENKSLDKKKNHFLSERRKSNDLEGKESEKSSSKHKDSEQTLDKSKSEKKNKHEVKHKDEKPRKSEEKREQPEIIEEKKSDDKSEKKSENVFNKSESTKKETPKIVSESIKEKKKDKPLSSHPENGKIKHDYNKQKYKEYENHKKHSTDKEPKLDNSETEKIDLKSANSANFYKNKLSHDSMNRKEIERKNSSSSSSLSDSVHSKSKSSYDSLESNNDEKRHDPQSSEHSFKRSEKHKSSNANDSSKEDKKSDRKKSDKSNMSSKRKKSRKRKTPSDSSSDSEFDSNDESKSNKKNHSIFEVVLDEPAYISMYDKVKARSTKNLQKQEEEKRQEKLKEKFNQLKQSRVKREEKKRSTSYDDDSDHEPAMRKGNKLILDSSDEEHSSNNDKTSKLNTQVSDSSDDDKKRTTDDEMKKFKKAARQSLNGKNKEKSKLNLTDTSDDEMKMKQKKEQSFLLANAEHKRKFKKAISKKKRPSSHKTENKKKIESDSEDDRKKFFESEKQKYSDLSDDEIQKPKKSFDKKPKKLQAEDFVKKKPKNNLKTMIESGELSKKNTFVPLDDDMKKKNLMSDVSEDEDMKLDESDHKSKLIDEGRVKLEKLLSDTSENDSIASCRFPKTKIRAIYSDDSELETKPRDKADELFYNLAELHHDYTKSENSSPPPLIDPMVYDLNDFQKKKSHKKKQKRQKSREHSIDRNKKHSKKERRKSVHSDMGDEQHKLKQKKKKKDRNKVKSIENLEEDIFGSMSDDSEKIDSRKLSKLSVSDVYDADSDSSNKDVREEAILENAKPDLEAKLFNSVENTNSYDNYFEHIKSKKKKRKKSKEEKSKHHHNHHHHHRNHHHTKHDDAPPALSLPCLIEPRPLEIGKEDTKEEDDEKPEDRRSEVVDIVTNSIAESHHENLQKKEDIPNVETKAFTPPPHDEIHDKAIQSISSENKNDKVHELAVKSIATDQYFHERAVLSISSSLTKSPSEVKEPIRIEEPKSTAPVVDDKTGITISQEETEDAVAAILGESSEFGFDDGCYPDDGMKPATPGSEPDLQIDTDTEDVKSDADAPFDISEPLSIENTIDKLNADIEGEKEKQCDKSTTDSSSTPMEIDTKNEPPKIEAPVPKPVTEIVPEKAEETKIPVADVLPAEIKPSETVESSTKQPSSFDVSDFTDTSTENSQSSTINEILKDDKRSEPPSSIVVAPEPDATSPVRKSNEKPEIDVVPKEPLPRSSPEPVAPAVEIESNKKSDNLKNRNNNNTYKRDHTHKVIDYLYNNYSTTPKHKADIENTLYAPYKPNNFSHFEPSKPEEKSVLRSVSPKDRDSSSEIVVEEPKKKARKRSYAECNGPTTEEPPTPEIENSIRSADVKLEPNPEPEPVSAVEEIKDSEPKNDITPVTPSVEIVPKPEILDSDASAEKDDPLKLVDHTYNTVVKHVKSEQLPDEPKQNVASPRSVICENELEIDTVAVIEKDTGDAEPKEKAEPEALKQLQIPANEKQCEPIENAVTDTTESNEANKENIVKTIVNQDITESVDDVKMNVIVKKERDIKEITKTVEEEIFRSVPNDFAKCNHRVPENNRNILEKVVQRIHESKRITQKTEDAQNADLTRIGSNDKVVLATEDEITSAKILLKMSESSVIKNKVSDYNCVIKIHDSVPDSEVDKSLECKFDGVKELGESKKNEAMSPNAMEQQEMNEDRSESVEDSGSGTKLGDHSYNAKRGRRRKAATPGGVVTRRAKQNNVVTKEPTTTESKVACKQKKPTDVYEFKEDSEEEVKRPRLILTIKSPVEQTQSAPVPATIQPVKEPTPPPSDAKPVISAETTPPGAKSASSANTRKSRRLQEKEGGSRNTVDDTIDEVIKSTANNRPTRRTTRIAAAAAAAIITTVHESTRKNSRTNRKPVSKQEGTNQPIPDAPSIVEDKDDFPSSPTIPPTLPSPPIAAPNSPVAAKISAEPTTLIDPVSGILIPMKEAEEGQYVPVLTELNQMQKSINDCPPEKKPRMDDTVVEESALALVKNAPEPLLTPKPIPKPMTISPKAPEPAVAVTTSVIASVAATTSLCKPAVASESLPPVAHSASIPPAMVEDGPISLIKTSTPSIIPPAAAMKSHTPPAAYNQTFPSLVYPQNQSVAKLHTSKTVTLQPRVTTPITPKAHVIQSMNPEGDVHSNDEVPYPPQYSSPLLHGAVASPPLGSPKISPQPIVSGANNSRVSHPLKNMVPLEPLKIDPAAGFFYMQNTSPQSRPAIAVQSPSPQSRVVHSTPSLGSGLLPHSAVQSAHYMHPQFMYQPYMTESSLTPYHNLPPPPSSAAATVIGSAKVIPDRDIIDGRQQQVTSAIAMTPSPPLELRKKSSPHNRLSDSPLITGPYVQTNRNFFYDEPIQAHRPLPPRIRVSTPPYASKVPQQGEPVDMYVPAQSRLHMETSRYGGVHDDIENDLPTRPYTDTSYLSHVAMQDTLGSTESELDYSRRRVVRLRDNKTVASRDSSPSHLDSPPLGDSPPQGNLDGTVLVQMYPIIWQGLLALKNDQAAVQMHVVSGNTSVAYDALPKLQDGYQPLLRIAQRMRLEQAQLEGVNRKMEIKDEHCTILGLPCGKNQEDVVQQATNLESYIIPYLKQKKAAGIINTAAPGTQQAAFVVHVFPPCEFADNVLLNAAPDLYRKVQETAYLVCIIVTV